MAKKEKTQKVVEEIKDTTKEQKVEKQKWRTQKSRKWPFAEFSGTGVHGQPADWAAISKMSKIVNLCFEIVISTFDLKAS